MEGKTTHNNFVAKHTHSGPRGHLLVLSARTPMALTRLAEALASDLSAAAPDPADLEYTCLANPVQLPVRRYFVFESIEQLRRQLAEPGETSLPAKGPTRPAVPVFLFPGGGVQHINMARDLYQSESYFKQVVDEGLQYAGRINEGVDFLGRLYPADARNNAELTDPEIALPLLFIIEYALARFLLFLGITPAAMIGHSLGEYVAAAIAGVFTYQEGIRIVSARGRLMKKVEPGLMLSVAAPVEAVRPFLGEAVSVGAINSPGHCMLSGNAAQIRTLRATLEAQGVQAKLLHIAVASHSHLMEPILDEFREVLRSIPVRQPEHLFISNLYGAWSTDLSFDAEYWVKHLRQPVLFSDGIARIRQAFPGCTFVEVGPGHTLSNLVNIHRQDGEAGPTVNLLRHPLSEADDQRFLLGALGELWSYGCPLDAGRLSADRSGKPVLLPALAALGTGPAAGEETAGEQAADPEDTGAAPLKSKIQSVLQQYLRRPVDIHDPILGYGLDNQDIAAISRQLEAELQLNLSRVLLLQHPTIENLVRFCRERHRPEPVSREDSQNRLDKAKSKIEKMRSVVRK
jgi:acyl transferase domain-containing protein